MRRCFTVQEVVDDAVSFCTQLADNALRHIREKYEGVCYQRCYIRRVEEITQLSTCTLPLTEPHKGVFSATFCAQVEFFDSVAKFTINKRTGIVLGSALHGLLVGSVVSPIEELAVGNTIPVVVGAQIRYVPMKKQVAAVVDLYTCRRNRVAYRLVRGGAPGGAPEDVQMSTHYAQVAVHLANEIKQIEVSQPAAARFFRELFYSFKTPRAVPQWGEERSLLEPLLLSEGDIVVRPLEAPADSTQCQVARTAPPDHTVIDVTCVHTIRHIVLKEVCIALRMLAECPDKYNTNEQPHIWAAIRAHQLE